MSNAQLDNEEFSLRISARAPKFLDTNGHAPDQKDDPLAQTWNRLTEAFSRLHGQRLYEVMERMFHEMPEDERVYLYWYSDESQSFHLLFSNGWAFDTFVRKVSDLNRPNSPYMNPFGEDNKSSAPKWMERKAATIDRWSQWWNLLHCWQVGPEVDHKAQERLQALDGGKGLSRADLPRIREALVGTQWQSSLDYIELATGTPPGDPKAGMGRRRGL